MALLTIWETLPAEVRSFSLEQVIKTAGDGRLLDGSECAREFRSFLRLVDAKMLKAYVAECLEKSGGAKTRNGFDGSGLALQDVVNEIGRRLGFRVEDGLYRGRKDPNANGCDGVWYGTNGLELVVEIKTTEAYTITLSTIENYRLDLIEQRKISENSSILFIVGRSETDALEEQIRGSRYAWSMRLIGVSSLVHLLEVMVRAESEVVAAQIRSLLKPVEYTRLDGIVDLVFRVREDVDEPIPDTPTSDIIGSSEILALDPVVKAPNEVRRLASSPPAPGTEGFRAKAVEKISERLDCNLVQRRRSLFESADTKTRVVVAVSKRYERTYQAYWYAYYDTQKAWLDEAANSWIAFCATDTGNIYLVPAGEMSIHLSGMNVTRRDAGSSYWHILVRMVGTTFTVVTGNEEISLDAFRIT